MLFFVDASQVEKYVAHMGRHSQMKHDPLYRAVRKRAKDAARSRSRKLRDHLKSGGCILCGEMFIKALAFHHIRADEKSHDPAKIRSSIVLHKEAKKCLVLCHNCHAKVHHGFWGDIKATSIKLAAASYVARTMNPGVKQVEIFPVWAGARKKDGDAGTA